MVRLADGVDILKGWRGFGKHYGATEHCDCRLYDAMVNSFLMDFVTKVEKPKDVINAFGTNAAALRTLRETSLPSAGLLVILEV